MRVIGLVVLVVGLVAGFGLWLFPTSVNVLGTTGTCGPPIIRVLNREEGKTAGEKNLTSRCQHLSAPRVVDGSIPLAIGVVVGGGLVMLDRRRSSSVAAAPASPPQA